MAKGSTGQRSVGRWDLSNAERAIRLWAGMVLMTFVTMHLLNHAIGVFGVAVMQTVQNWRVEFWRFLPLTILLYGALAAHVVIALKRVVSRRTWRMPVSEAIQIALGIAIPILLVRHVIGTRIVHSFGGVDDNYINLLRYLWPENALWQSTALIVTWTHGIIGLNAMLRTKTWFGRYQIAFTILAFVIPILALAGFVSAGREAHTLTTPVENWNKQQVEVHNIGLFWGRVLVWGGLALAAALLIVREGVRRLRKSVTVRYVGHGETSSPVGLTLLEMSRSNNIPHPSVCGGRGRCSTCRVLVTSDLAALPPRNGIEDVLLAKIRAPQRVRLACQLRPTADIDVKILLPVDADGKLKHDFDEALTWGADRDLTVLFADIRSFSTLARTQQPEDIVIVLTRVIDDLNQAIRARGGRTVMVLTDGVMGIFNNAGLGSPSARAGLDAAADMLKAVEAANREFGGALPLPLRIGVGIHVGHAVVVRLGDETQGYTTSVIGETVSIASRLEEATKELAADCVVSEEALAFAGLKGAAGLRRSVHYKNLDEPVPVRAFSSRRELENLLGRTPHEAELADVRK